MVNKEKTKTNKSILIQGRRLEEYGAIREPNIIVLKPYHDWITPLFSIECPYCHIINNKLCAMKTQHKCKKCGYTFILHYTPAEFVEAIKEEEIYGK